MTIETAIKIVVITYIVIIIFLLLALVYKIREYRSQKYKKEMSQMDIEKTENNIEKTENDIAEQNNIIEKTENDIAEQNNIIDMKGFLEIENKCRRLVEIKEISVTLEDDSTSTIYLLQIAGINIRFFIDPNEAAKESRFMQKVVKQVIEKGSAAKVEVKELISKDSIYYLLQIADKNIKIYTGKEEAGRVASYMTTVVDAILQKS
jgi:hypothetical protein